MISKQTRKVEAILFSANPKLVDVKDAIGHLKNHKKIYWEVRFKISNTNCTYPLLGFIHICKGQVEYRVTIENIVRFSRAHYEDNDLAQQVKPETWIREWKDNINDVQTHKWEHALVITEIVPFPYDTYAFRKCDGTMVKHPPQRYIRVLPPDNATDSLLADEFGYDPDDRTFKEGKAKLVLHLVKERNRTLVNLAKKSWLTDGNLHCEACAFSFKKTYGIVGEEYIEAHHKEPIEALAPDTIARIEDLVPVCSNCHSMLHRHRPWLTLDQLKSILQK